jgi:hypothetical protein
VTKNRCASDGYHQKGSVHQYRFRIQPEDQSDRNRPRQPTQDQDAQPGQPAAASQHVRRADAAVPTVAESLDDGKEIDKFLWERSHLNSMEKPWEKTVIFGHTPRPEPVQDSKMIGIDTGCVYQRVGYGKLTAVKLPEKEFVQQECID